jgi:hypothetical protein
MGKEARAWKVYRRICKAADLEGAVRELGARPLRELRGMLARRGNISGVPGLVYGLVTVVCADRFMEMQESNTGGRND